MRYHKFLKISFIYLKKSLFFCLVKMSRTINSSNWSLLIQPFICTVGVIANGLNIAVFLNPKMKDVTFKYMLAISISDCIYLGLLSYVSFLSCSDCLFTKNYATAFYAIFIDDYLTSCLGIFALFIDITLSVQRFFILKNKYFCQKLSYKLTISILLLIALLYYLPVTFFKNIVEIENTNSTNCTEYAAVLNKLGQTSFGNLTPVVITSFRIFLGTVVLTSINLVNAYEFKKRMEKKVKKAPNSIELSIILIISCFHERLNLILEFLSGPK